jgi:di/tripeptidase
MLGVESPGMSDNLLSRFLRYVRLDTQSDENSTTFPSTPGQLVLLEMLKRNSDPCIRGRALAIDDQSKP